MTASGRHVASAAGRAGHPRREEGAVTAPRRRRTSGQIDWAAVRQRLAHVQAATTAAVELSEERVRALMDERARVLARAPAQAAPPDAFAVVTFALGSDRYAIEARYVREAIRLPEFSPVPGAPEFVLGVASLRGELVCLVDLRRLFGLPPTERTERSRMIVLGAERVEFGILADEAFEVRHMRPADIVPPLETVSAGGECLLGVTRDALMVLDGAALLEDPRLFVTDQASPAA